MSPLFNLMQRTLICSLFAILPLLGAFTARAQQVKIMEYDASQEVGANTNPVTQATAFARIIAYQQPDIVCFSELNDGGSATPVAAGVINWVTNNLASVFGTKTGVTFWVYIANVGDGYNRNGEISRYPIISGTTYSDVGGGFPNLRGMDSIQIQLSGTNVLQIFHAQLKAGGGTLDTNSNCERKQAEAATDATNMMNWASTNLYPYIWTCDCNEDEDPRDAGYTAPYTTPECPISSTYHPVATLEQIGGLVDYAPTTLDGVWKTWSTAQTAGQPSDMFDRVLAATNRLSPASGLVFSTFDWALHGLYTNASPQNLVNDSLTADDHFDVMVTYSFPTAATNFSANPASLIAGGSPGGPFTPSSQFCVLTNFDTIPLFWSITNKTSWLKVSPSVGNLGDGLGTNINVGITAAANALAAGTYTDTITFSNTATGVSLLVGVTLTVGSPLPVASFTGSPTNGVAPLTVTFTDTSTGSITNWSWSFGDGGTTNLATNSVLYTYNTAGVYSVAEIVSGPGGSSTNTQVNYVTVLTPFQAWQVQYFGSTTNPAAAANADPDGDGQNNLAEFLTGTNPTNSLSGFRITSVTTQGGDVLVNWTTAGGHTNVVQATAGLPDGSYSNNFLDLSPFIIIPGSGDATTNYLDSGGATNVPSRYYRIRVQP